MKEKVHSEIQLQNNAWAQRLVDYLNGMPCAITPELMEEVAPQGGCERIYQALLSGFLGLDPDREEDRLLEDTYLRPGVHELSANTFLNNDYYRLIQIPQTGKDAWHFGYESYQPYEAFVCDDLQVTPEGVEIPQIGYFTQPFRYPAVYENGREWMAIKPSEIRSMEEPVKAVSGRVVTFGLGLGYYTFMVSQKPSVESITVVERDPSIIDLFRTYLLPQFPHREKVQLVQADALEYLQHLPQYDYAFVDLWHDASDGLPLYLQVKAMAQRYPGTQFLYWVERTLQSAERWKGSPPPSS